LAVDGERVKLAARGGTGGVTGGEVGDLGGGVGDVGGGVSDLDGALAVVWSGDPPPLHALSMTRKKGHTIASRLLAGFHCAISRKTCCPDYRDLRWALDRSITYLNGI